MAFHPETRHPQSVTPGGTGATLRPGVCLGGARIRVPSLGKPGIPPETSNFYCLPGRAGGTPNVLDVLVDDRPALSAVADRFRQDLADAGIGNGRYGYSVPM
jgi:hypothetical protein